jgi:hypothetical protein
MEEITQWGIDEIKEDAMGGSYVTNGRDKNVYRDSVRTRVVKRPSGRPRHRSDYNIVYLKEITLEGIDCI